MTTTERALMILVATYDGMVADVLGAMLWPKRTGRICAVHGGGDYAAQMLLGRMRKAGLVRRGRSPGATVWELTGEGKRAAVRALQDARKARAKELA